MLKPNRNVIKRLNELRNNYKNAKWKYVVPILLWLGYAIRQNASSHRVAHKEGCDSLTFTNGTNKSKTLEIHEVKRLLKTLSKYGL